MVIRKLFALIYKDSLIILKDKAGLGYLFALPVILVFVMVLIQDSSFKAIHDFDIKVVLLNHDKDSLGNAIVNELKNTGYFTVTEILDDKTESLKEMVAKGYYKMGIVIPDSMTYKMRRVIKKQTARSFSGINDSILNNQDSTTIEIFFDPITLTSYKLMLLSMLREYSAKIENRLIMGEIQKYLPFSRISTKNYNVIAYEEKQASIEGALIIPNSVQHNVPAWTVFAMFFIVMSLAGNMIKEREEGIYTRLSSMPFPLYLYLTSKVITYIAIGFIQFTLMMLMGIYVLPLIDFPALNIGGKYFSLLLTAFISSLAAVGYALLVGTFAKTYQQSSTLGSISVVIFAAIGGVWVPVIAMPGFMRTISVISPLNWAVEAFNSILVNNLSFVQCFKEYALLIVFFILCLSISVKYFSFQTNK